jgi:hypothetical protein
VAVEFLQLVLLRVHHDIRLCAALSSARSPGARWEPDLELRSRKCVVVVVVIAVFVVVIVVVIVVVVVVGIAVVCVVVVFVAVVVFSFIVVPAAENTKPSHKQAKPSKHSLVFCVFSERFVLAARTTTAVQGPHRSTAQSLKLFGGVANVSLFICFLPFVWPGLDWQSIDCWRLALFCTWLPTRGFW